MREHKDPSVQWMYTRVQVIVGNVADISDCGMIYYLLVGDEHGSPEKFREFIGDSVL